MMLVLTFHSGPFRTGLGMWSSDVAAWARILSKNLVVMPPRLTRIKINPDMLA
jgi:hypothetical protein